MADTTVVARDVDIVQRVTTNATESPFSWGAVVAGAIAATAVSFLLIAFGIGIGFLGASPYSSWASLTTLTIVGAMWVIFAQTCGYMVGGYFAGRLRTRASVLSTHATNFRDAAHGFVAWALGVVLILTAMATATAVGVGATANVGAAIGAGTAAGAASRSNGAASPADPTAYFVDLLFRSEQPPADPAASDTRAEIGRIMANAVRNDGMAAEDRAYIARVVAGRTGLSQQEADRRVEQVELQARQAAREAADKASKAAAFASFWAAMALLLGATAGVVGGVIGGNQRDEELAG